eukprot:3898298-Pleurochrysis_carterae.AAC.2
MCACCMRVRARACACMGARLDLAQPVHQIVERRHARLIRERRAVLVRHLLRQLLHRRLDQRNLVARLTNAANGSLKRGYDGMQRRHKGEREPRPWCKKESAIFFIARSCWYVACMNGEHVTYRRLRWSA